jgi:hypothetical protein
MRAKREHISDEMWRQWRDWTEEHSPIDANHVAYYGPPVAATPNRCGGCGG